MKLSSFNRGLSAGIGSGSVTSKAAAAMYPLVKAVYSALGSTTPPRAVLMRQAVGFIFFSCLSPRICFVSGVSGVCIETMSDSVSNWSRSTCSTSNLRIMSGDR